MQKPALSIEMIGVVVLTVTLAVVLVAYDRMLKKMQKWQSGEKDLEDIARKKSEKIIEFAKLKAQKVLNEATLQGRQLHSELARMVDQAEETQLDEYKQKLQSITNSVEQRLEQGADEFGKVLEMETLAAQRAVAKRIQSDYAKVEMEIEEYRQNRLKEVEAATADGLKAGLKIAIGEALNESEKENLVMRAIEEAKKQHVI